MTALFAETALLPEGWRRNVRLEWDAAGCLVRVAPDAEADGAERAAGPVIPGMPNLHSHAFQRAMAGLAERSSGGAEDNFWTWREAMYAVALKLDPEMLRAVAAQLYIEMLKAGYTSVAEFHYLHHDKDGQPYADRSAMSAALVEAARETGIGMTLLPVVYQTAGFGGAPPGKAQRRFVNTTDGYLRLFQDVAALAGNDPQLTVGVAFHSLRAVPLRTIGDVRAALGGRERFLETHPSTPFHIHVAEQQGEVDECLAWSGRRPVELLLDEVGPGPLWCLVHATHITERESEGVARSGVTVGLCPTTEANLGDGIFPFAAYEGFWGIGSDSHVSVSPVEELRWLEYGQRLVHRHRNVATARRPGSTGAALWTAAVSSGARVMGRMVGALRPGFRADLLVIDDELPALYGRREDRLLDALVFAGNQNAARDVMVGGSWVVRDCRHPAEERAYQAFKKAIR